MQNVNSIIYRTMEWIKVNDLLPEQENERPIDDDTYFVELATVYVLYKDYRYGKDCRMYDKDKGWYWQSRRTDIIAWTHLNEINTFDSWN